MGQVKTFHAPLPSDKEPIADIIARGKRSYKRRLARRQAEEWLPIRIPEHQGLPFAISFVGDMHIDNPGCNLELLEKDLQLIANTKGMYGVFIGDGTDNWVGRLMSLYAKHDIPKHDGLRLFRWALLESGVDWLCGLLGNHDLWNDGAMVLDLLTNGQMYLPKWEAKLDIRAGRQSWKVHAAHNFKGQSQWNPTHGPLKTAIMQSPAELLVAGHLHTGGLQSFELPGQNRIVHVARARGYKFDDDYALVGGFAEHQHGATVMALFDPQAKSAAQRIQLFYDLEQGAEMLTALREFRAWQNAPKEPARKSVRKITKKPAAKKAPAKRKAKRKAS